MICKNCGWGNAPEWQSCAKCGKPLPTSEAATTVVSSPPVQTDTTTVKHKFEAGKIFKGSYIFVLSAAILGGISLAALGKGDLVHPIKVIVNWLLALFGLFSVFGMAFGFVIGIVLLLQNKANKAEEEYYKRTGLWLIAGPIGLLVLVVLAYVLFNVIVALVDPSIPIKTNA